MNSIIFRQFNDLITTKTITRNIVIKGRTDLAWKKYLVILFFAFVSHISAFFLLWFNFPNPSQTKCEVLILSEPSEIECELPGMDAYFSSYLIICGISFNSLILFVFDNRKSMAVDTIPIGDHFFLCQLKKNVSESKYSNISNNLQFNTEDV